MLAESCIEGIDRLIWPNDPRLEKHVIRLKRLLEEHMANWEAIESVVDIFVPLVWLLDRRGRWKDALWMAKMYSRAMERTHGVNSLPCLFGMELIGSNLLNLNRLVEVQGILEQVLDARKRLLSPTADSTLDVVNYLGLIYARLDDITPAEVMSRRALQGREELLGIKNPKTPDCATTLTNTYMRMGRHEEARDLNRRVLDGFESTLGSEHYLTLSAIRNQGVILVNLFQLKQSEFFLQRALIGTEKVLGENHHKTLDTKSALGLLFRDKKRL